MAHDFWSRLLCRRNDASLHSPLRPRSPRYNFPCFSPPVGRYDCGWHSHQQDGSSTTTSVRSDARSTMGYFHGQLCQRRRILSLQLFRHKRLRQDCARRYLRTGMPSNVRSVDVWYLPTAEEDEAYQDYTYVVQEVVEALCFRRCGLA